jgi:hypothetical protein
MRESRSQHQSQLFSLANNVKSVIKECRHALCLSWLGPRPFLPGDMSRPKGRAHLVFRAGHAVLRLARPGGEGPFNLAVAILGQIG